MARTPIITIPVDDEAFKRFSEMWKEYQASLGEQGDKWAEVNENVATMASAFALVTVALEAHNELLARQKQIAKEEAEEEKKKVKALKDQDKLEQDAERRRHKAVEDTKKIAHSVADTAVGLAKWAALGGAAGVVGGALSFWGLDRFVAGIGNTRRSALGYGVDTGQMQSMDVHLQRYFDVHSLLENVAESVADPSRRQYFSALGVDPRGKQTADLAAETATRAAQMFIAGHGNEAWAQAHGLTNFFSMDELRRMATEYQAGRLQSDIGAARKDWAPGGAFAMADDVSRGWQTFVVNLNRAGLALEDKLLIKLNALGGEGGPLDKVIDAFTDLALTALDRVDFTAIARGLDAFAGYIGSGKFQTDFKTFIDDVGAVAAKMVDVLTMLGIIPGHAAVTPSAVAAQGGTATTPKAPFTGGGIVGQALHLAGAGAPGSGAWAMGAEAWSAKNLMKWGWSEDQAAGIMENIKAESGFDPFAQGDYSRKQHRYTAYGLGQWHGDRQAQYAKLFGHSMQSVKNPQAAEQEQLEFYNWELNNTFAGAGRHLHRAKSRYDAGYIVSEEFERPRGGDATAAMRGIGATLNIVIHLDNKTGSAPSVGANAGSR